MSRFDIGFEFEFYSKLNHNEVVYTLRALLRKNRIRAQITSDDLCNAKKRFVVKDDPSICPPSGQMYWNTYEVATPPMPRKTAIAFMNDFFKWIELYGETNSSCGLHVNISFSDKKKQDKLSDWKIVLAYDDAEVLRTLRRKRNIYCRSLRERIAPYVMKRADMADVDSVVNHIQNYVENYYRNKYMAVNVSRLDDGYVEFRALGGKDYHKRGDYIRDEIERMLNALETAALPDRSDQIMNLIGEVLNVSRQEIEVARTR